MPAIDVVGARRRRAPPGADGPARPAPRRGLRPRRLARRPRASASPALSSQPGCGLRRGASGHRRRCHAQQRQRFSLASAFTAAEQGERDRALGRRLPRQPRQRQRDRSPPGSRSASTGGSARCGSRSTTSCASPGPRTTRSSRSRRRSGRTTSRRWRRASSRAGSRRRCSPSSRTAGCSSRTATTATRRWCAPVSRRRGCSIWFDDRGRLRALPRRERLSARVRG